MPMSLMCFAAVKKQCKREIKVLIIRPSLSIHLNILNIILGDRKIGFWPHKWR